MKSSSKEWSLSASIILNIIGFVLLRSISFITTPIITRMISIDNYGIISVYNAWVSVFFIIVGIQMNSTITNAKLDFSKQEYPHYLASIMALSFFSFLFFWFIFIIGRKWLISLFELDMFVFLLLIPHCFASYCVSFCSNHFLAQKKALANLILNLTVSICTAVLSITLIWYSTQRPYIGNILGLAIPNIVAAIFIFIAIIRNLKLSFLTPHLRYALPIALPLIFHGLGLVVLAQSDRIMIRHLVGDTQSGVYSYTYTLTGVLQACWMAINNVWVHHYFELLKTRDTKLITKKVRSYNITFTCLTAGFLMVCPEFLKIMAPKEYWGGLSLVPILVFSIYLNYLYVFYVSYETFRKKTSWMAIGTTISAFLNIALNILLIPQLEILGAALATLLSYGMLFIFHAIISRCFIKEYPVGHKPFLFGSSIMIGFCVFYYIFLNTWPIRWGVATIIGIFLLCKIWRNKAII